MSTLALFDPLSELLDLEDVQQCRFCGCSEDSPCAIPVVYESDGKARLARGDEEVAEIFPCGWCFPGVCYAPACMEKLILESRGRVLLFDAEGRKVG